MQGQVRRDHKECSICDYVFVIKWQAPINCQCRFGSRFVKENFSLCHTHVVKLLSRRLVQTTLVSHKVIVDFLAQILVDTSSKSPKIHWCGQSSWATEFPLWIINVKCKVHIAQSCICTLVPFLFHMLQNFRHVVWSTLASRPSCALAPCMRC